LIIDYFTGITALFVPNNLNTLIS